MGSRKHECKLAQVIGQEYIRVVGANDNNLKNVSIDIPKRKLTVFTGVSGSGKSSLVFDTVAAESQRLINETTQASCKVSCNLSHVLMWSTSKALPRRSSSARSRWLRIRAQRSAPSPISPACCACSSRVSQNRTWVDQVRIRLMCHR